MLNFIKRLKNRKAIENLKSKLEGLKIRYESLETKLEQDLITAKYAESHIKESPAVSYEEAEMSKAVYWEEVNLDKRELEDLRKTIKLTLNTLKRLGYTE